ncbi:MAG: AAA family ATPase, partial [Lachnospiraceae bacterium]|nr:AAA family ATPase [Lachnospiraceae bacterium]
MAAAKKKTKKEQAEEQAQAVVQEQKPEKTPEKKPKESAADKKKGAAGDVFADYGAYTDHVFACVNTALDGYLTVMKRTYAAGQGGYKNVLYPDIEIASDLCREKLDLFEQGIRSAGTETAAVESEAEQSEETLDDDLLDLLGEFSESMEAPEESAQIEAGAIQKRLAEIEEKARDTVAAGCALPLHSLAETLNFEPFTRFTFACGILASMQTDYAGVFQIINENGNMSAPTIESAAKLWFGDSFSITRAYGDMSVCLEQLLPMLRLNVNSAMPFSTEVSPDKRMIDFLFGRYPLRIDENYDRFFTMLTKNEKEELDPILANEGVLDAMKISYGDGVRIFYYYGDEGSGRKFFVKKFCAENGLRAITINCKKLFSYDFRFVDEALWAVVRECILTNACCCLTELSFHEEEKEKFHGYMDLAFNKLTEKGVLVFAMSKEYLQLKDITREQFTELELPTPSTGERQSCWEYFSKNFQLADEIDLLEMSTKFLFTAGKIHDALKHARSLAAMKKEILISRDVLFQGCYAQMSSELTQKATKIKANFGFEDIVMNPTQKETLLHAIDQMNFRKQVYENWHYTKKYPYGRGLSVLLFGAPGTGKSMCAQVIAHELNLELYRVDLSKVIDKYVGETEKSISMIFREAKKCNVVLFFDECDTLFAKRSDDGGSNQASNNNKTALLLQEVEAYD